MKKLLLCAAWIVPVTAFALPTYEPFTEFGNLVSNTGSNLVAAVQGVPLNNASSYISDAIDLPTGGLTAPTGEPWTSLNFSGMNASGGPGLQGLDVAIVNDNGAYIFPETTLSGLLPNTFPGYPTVGGAINTYVENPAQPLLMNAGGTYVESNSIVGNSPVLRFSQDIVRPASGSATIFVSYLLNIPQQGQLGNGNDGRYLAFLSQSNLVAGAHTTGTYSNFFEMFNAFGAGVRTPGHGLLARNATPSPYYYIGPCDETAGKDFANSPWIATNGTPVFVVGEYQLSSGVSDTNVVWVNPGATNFGGYLTPTNFAIDIVPAANRPSDIAGLVLIDRPGNGTAGGVGTNYIANLLIGTTWSYVTGGPEFTNQPVASTNLAIGHSFSLTANAVAAAQTVSYRWQKVSGGITNNLTDGSGAAGGSATVSGSGTPILTLTGITVGDIGIYQLMATASGTSYSLSSSPAVVGLTDPQVATNPAAATTNYGGTLKFVAQLNTSYSPLKYQWFHGSTPLFNGTQTDGSSASGATGTTGSGTSFTVTLTLTGVSYQDMGNYTLFATNSINSVGFTVPASAAVADPCIVTSPARPSVAPGGDATFTVVAAGSPALTYQWYENGHPLTNGVSVYSETNGNAIVSGAQTATLTVSSVDDSANGNYSCAVTGSASGQIASSAAAPLVVQDPLTVLLTPQSLTERAGDHTAFAVTVSGGGPLFQWYLNGNSIAGATNSSLVLTNIQTANSGAYSVTVQNASTSSQSYPANLTVLNSAVLPLYSTNILVARVGDRAQTLSGATGNTLYLDQFAEDGTYVSTLQVPDENVGAPYGSGSSASVFGSPALIFPGAGNDASNAALLSISGPGQQYITLGGYCEAYPFSGSDVTIASQANASPAYSRGLATINAFGIYTLVYTNVGLFNGGNHTIRSVVTSDGTNFWATGQAGTAGVKYMDTALASIANGTGIPGVASSSTGPTVAQIVNGSLVFSDPNATNSSGQAVPGLYICAGLPEPPFLGLASSSLLFQGYTPVDFAFSPDTNTVYIADSGAWGAGGGVQRWDYYPGSGYSITEHLTVDPNYNVGAGSLAVDFSASTNWGPGVYGAKLFATTCGISSNSLVSFVDDGSGYSTPTVLLAVGKNNGLRSVRFGPAVVAPSLTQQPQSETVRSGSPAALSASATGTGPFTYQWYFQAGGVGTFKAIAGATNATYSIASMGSGAAGNYYVVITSYNSVKVQSQTASLTLAAPPSFTSEAYLGRTRGILLDFTGTAGQRYSIYSSTNISMPFASWSVLTTGGTFSGGTDSYMDTSGTNARQFYIITSP